MGCLKLKTKQPLETQPVKIVSSQSRESRNTSIRAAFNSESSQIRSYSCDSLHKIVNNNELIKLLCMDERCRNEKPNENIGSLESYLNYQYQEKIEFLEKRVKELNDGYDDLIGNILSEVSSISSNFTENMARDIRYLLSLFYYESVYTSKFITMNHLTKCLVCDECSCYRTCEGFKCDVCKKIQKFEECLNRVEIGYQINQDGFDRSLTCQDLKGIRKRLKNILKIIRKKSSSILDNLSKNSMILNLSCSSYKISKVCEEEQEFSKIFERKTLNENKLRKESESISKIIDCNSNL
jgi:hypothetical protein